MTLAPGAKVSFRGQLLQLQYKKQMVVKCSVNWECCYSTLDTSSRGRMAFGVEDAQVKHDGIAAVLLVRCLSPSQLATY